MMLYVCSIQHRENSNWKPLMNTQKEHLNGLNKIFGSLHSHFGYATEIV